jgi:hypothetical protein
VSTQTNPAAETLDTDDLRRWVPTHEITIEQTSSPYRRDQMLVMLVEEYEGEGGPAYSIEEWDTADAAAWSCDASGEWTIEGQCTPGGRTDVTAAVRVPVYLATEAERVREEYAARARRCGRRGSLPT